MIKLSIIVPVYNVKNYLDECLQSILNINGIEKQIICIEDCSTDGSSEMLFEKYGAIEDIEIYKNEGNMGLSFARNQGLRYAKGQYILFVDSDDYLNSMEIENLIETMNQNALDILYFDVKEFSDGIIIKSNDKRIRKGKYNLDQGTAIFDQMVKNGEMFGSVWSGIYSKAFLDEHNIRFINGILHEDMPFTFKALLCAKRVEVCGVVGYFYRQRQNSILHQTNQKERAAGLLMGYLQMMVVWQDLAYLPRVKAVEKSLCAYTNSVLDRVENYGRFEQENGCEEYNELPTRLTGQNLRINKYRKIEAIKRSGWIDSIKNYVSVGFYGAGKMAEIYLPFLSNEGIKIENILVSNTDGNKKKACGISVIKYSAEINRLFDAIIIGVMGDASIEIKNNLLSNGYKGTIINLPEVE